MEYRSSTGSGITAPLRPWRIALESIRRRPAGRRTRKDSGWSPLCHERRGQARHEKQLQAYENLCREISQLPADVALAWLLQNPAVTAPIIGPRTKEQLIASLTATDILLAEDTLARLDAIWPEPGGEPPEAYA